MKVFRWIVVGLLTAAALLVICAPVLLQRVVPPEYIQAVSLDQFPLLSTCGRIARQLANTIASHGRVTADIVVGSLGEGFWDELVALIMVAVLTIPVSMALKYTLYHPLQSGLLWTPLLYASLNLCSVLIAWVLYRQLYFRLIVEGLIEQYINEGVLQTAVNYVTQLLSAFLVGAAAIKIAMVVLAAHFVINRMVMPLIGTLIRTLLFAFLVAQILLLRENPDSLTVLACMMAATLAVSGVSDAIFGTW